MQRPSLQRLPDTIVIYSQFSFATHKYIKNAVETAVQYNPVFASCPETIVLKLPINALQSTQSSLQILVIIGCI